MTQRFGLFLADLCLGLIGLVASYSVGGPNLVVLLVSAVLVGRVAIRRGVNPTAGLLSGLVIAILWVCVIGAVLVPLLKLLPGSDSILFQKVALRSPATAGEFVYVSFHEIKRFVTLLLAALPISALLWLEMSYRSAARDPQSGVGIPSSAMSGLRPAIVVMLTPLVLTAIRKAWNPYELLASTMSGDGRNFFLTVENIRMTSSPTKVTSLLGQGNFFPSLAGHLSIGMGAGGRLDVRDQFAIVAVYVLASCLIFLSIATYVTEILLARRSKDGGTGVQDSRLWVFCPMFLVAGLIAATFGPVMNMTFRGGFFSLYGAMAIVGTYLAVSLPAHTAWKPAVQIAVLVLLAATYPLGLGVLILPLLRDGGRWMWRFAKGNRQLGGVLTAGAIVVGLITWSSVLDKTRGKAVANGWILPINNLALIPICVVSATCLMVVRRKSSSRLFTDILLVVLSGTITNFILQTERERAGLSGTGYYGEKNDFIIYFGVVFLTLSALVIVTMAATARLMTRFGKSALRQIVGATIFTILFGGLVWAGTSRFESSQTLLKRTSPWQQPTAESAEFAIGNWNADDLVFLDPANLSEGRIVDFWLPYFWRMPGYMWAYNEFSVEPTKVCSLLRKQPARVATPDKGLKQQIVSACGQFVLPDEKTN